MEDIKEITKERVVGVIKANSPHVAADWVNSVIKKYDEELKNIETMLGGRVEKKKVAEYIKKYLLK